MCPSICIQDTACPGHNFVMRRHILMLFGKYVQMTLMSWSVMPNYHFDAPKGQFLFKKMVVQTSIITMNRWIVKQH